jgi:hypothetical protein
MPKFNQVNAPSIEIAQSADDSERKGGTVVCCTPSKTPAMTRHDIEVRAAQVKSGWSDQERRSRRRAGRLAFMRLATLIDRTQIEEDT